MGDSLDDVGSDPDRQNNLADQSDPPQHSRLWSLGGLLVVVVVALLLVPIPFKGRVTSAIGDLVHAPLFGGLTLAILGLMHRFLPQPPTGGDLIRRCAIVGFGVFTFGVSMEIMQHVSVRSGNLHDAVANGLGIIAALLFFLATRQKARWPGLLWLRIALLGFAAVALAFAWLGPARMIWDDYAMKRSFPKLASFDSNIEITRFYFRECSGTLSTQDATDGTYAMSVSYQGTQNPSFTLVELQRDWSNMQSFEMDVTLDDSYPADEVDFAFSILDEHHANYATDLFHRIWKLQPGKTVRVSVSRNDILGGPQDREMDLTQIKFVDMGLNQPVAPTTVRFDSITLQLRD